MSSCKKAVLFIICTFFVSLSFANIVWADDQTSLSFSQVVSQRIEQSVVLPFVKIKDESIKFASSIVQSSLALAGQAYNTAKNEVLSLVDVAQNVALIQGSVTNAPVLNSPTPKAPVSKPESNVAVAIASPSFPASATVPSVSVARPVVVVVPVANSVAPKPVITQKSTTRYNETTFILSLIAQLQKNIITVRNEVVLLNRPYVIQIPASQNYYYNSTGGGNAVSTAQFDATASSFGRAISDIQKTIPAPIDTSNLATLNVDGGSLFVDTVNNRVGIGTTTPAYTLDVNGTAHFDSIVTGGQTIGGNFGVTGLGSFSQFVATSATSTNLAATNLSVGGDTISDITGTGLSVNGGALQVSLASFSTDNLAEGTSSKYYTDARARTAFSVASPLLYSSSTGFISMMQTSSTSNGYLSSADYTAFVNKVSSQWATNGSNISYTAGNVGINNNAPAYTLDVSGNINATGSIYGSGVESINPTARKLFASNGTTVQLDYSTANAISMAGAGTPVANSNFLGSGAGYGATNAYLSNFLGSGAGYGATNAYLSNFLGNSAGYGATNAYLSNFLGSGAGYGATNVYLSNFLGNNAGGGATNAYASNFLGYSAGSGATYASESIFIGTSAGYNDTVNNTGNSGTSIAIGRYSGTGGFSNSIAIGRGVINSAAQQLNIGNVIYATGIYNSDTQSSAALSGGNVGIGTTTPTEKFVVIGNAQFTGVSSGAFANDLSLTSTGVLTTSASDRRLKENLNELASSTLDKVALLKPYTFTWIKDPEHKTDYGLIAQDVQSVFPDLVFINHSDGFLGINYSRFTAILIKSIQELNTKIDALALSIKNAVFETLTVGSREKPSGITIYDEATGDPYCLKIRNGQQVSVAGTCTNQSASAGSVAPVVPSSGASQPQNQTEPEVQTQSQSQPESQTQSGPTSSTTSTNESVTAPAVSPPPVSSTSSPSSTPAPTTEPESSVVSSDTSGTVSTQ